MTSQFIIRLYEQKWNSLDNEEMKSKDPQESFAFLKEEGQGTFKGSRDCDLSLNQIKSKLNIIPCTRISLHLTVSHIENDVKKDVNDFLRIFGSSVTHLFIDSSQQYPFMQLSSKGFWNLLCKQLPNLESLTFQNDIPFRLKWTGVGSNVQVDPPPFDLWNKKLVNLKFLSFRETFHIFCGPILSQLLKLAPKLESIIGCPFDVLTETLQCCRRPNTLKSFTYSPTQFYWNCGLTIYTAENILKVLQQLTDQHDLVNLEELKLFVFFPSLPISVSSLLPHFRKSFRKSFQNLVEGNKNSLQRLDIQPLESINFLNFPRLEKLTCLGFFSYPPHISYNIQDKKYRYRQFFPLDFDPFETFPHLSTVNISILVPDDEKEQNEIRQFQEYFPQQTFKSVQNLQLSEYMPQSCVHQLVGLFPNIVKLKIIMAQPKMCKLLAVVLELWTLEELSLDFGEELWRYLDTCVLTNILEKKLDFLRNSFLWKYRIEEHQKQHSNCNLEELRELKLAWTKDRSLTSVDLTCEAN